MLVGMWTVRPRMQHGGAVLHCLFVPAVESYPRICDVLFSEQRVLRCFWAEDNLAKWSHEIAQGHNSKTVFPMELKLAQRDLTLQITPERKRPSSGMQIYLR